MFKKNQRGFGIGTLIVIIAIVLIIGAYIYYSGNSATPVTPAPATTESVVVPAAPAGSAMETGSDTTPLPVPSATVTQ